MYWPFYSRPILFINAGVVGDHGVFASSLRIKGGLIDGLDVKPNPADTLIDLNGAYIFPGLINAHDHFEHNHYGRVKFQEKYANASEWAKDMSVQLAVNPLLVQGKSKPLEDKLFIGGIKNLLSGVVTVAHHNPFYKELKRPFPVRVVKNYGWAHSYYLQGGKAGAGGEQAGDISLRYHATSKNHPFMVHIAEGVDVSARNEFKWLKDIGCLGANTVLIHGVGLSVTDWVALVSAGAGLVWCPASNLFLLKQTLPVREFLNAGGESQMALGSDSRLTGSRDLLDEMKAAINTDNLTPQEVFRMVTGNPANLLRLPAAGKLSINFPADLLIIPRTHTDPFEALTSCSRKDILLVAINGWPQYGALQLSDLFQQLKVKTALIQVDGEEKLLAKPWAYKLQNCSLTEAGVLCLKI